MRLITVVAAMLSVGSSTLFATIISDNTYIWSTDAGQRPIASVEITVFDNFQGDTSTEEWRYSITNLGFLTAPDRGGTQHGIGDLSLYIPRDNPYQVLYRLANFYQPEGWFLCRSCFNFGSLWDVSWYVAQSPQIGLLPGESATFGFTINNSAAPRPPGAGTGPNTVLTATMNGALGFWEEGKEGSRFQGPIDVPGPAVPEPASIVTAAAGIAALLAWKAVRRPA